MNKQTNIDLPNKHKQNIFGNFRLLKNPFALIFYIIIILYVLSLLIPSAWMIVTTFKDRLEFRFNRFGWPENFTLENYLNVFSKMYVTVSSATEGIKFVYVPQLMFNGFIYSVVSVAAGLVMQTLVAYGVAKYRSKMGTFLHSFAIVTMILPLVGSLAASLLLYRRLHLYDNFAGIIWAHAGWGGSHFLILISTFKSISDDYRDAAFVDGASHLRVMLQIMLPMVKTTYVALFILGFIGRWNDYMTPMVYLPSMPTIAYGLFQFRYSSDSIVSAIPMQITGCVVVMVPIIVIFCVFRNKIMGNLAIGGLKG